MTCRHKHIQPGEETHAEESAHSTSPGRGSFKEIAMVILLDKHKKPAGFTTEAHLRRLCRQKRAVIYRKFPCVAILMDRDTRDFAGIRTYRIKIDPGAKHTGIAIVCNETNEVMFFMQIEHRGETIKKAMDTKRGARRNRRARETRYRRCKFKAGRSYDSSRGEGWLPPSVKSTADNIISWVRRLGRWINLTECSFEAVRFDTQLLDNPEIEGVEYQQGTLFGYEVKEYLLDKYGHTCQYCGGKTGDRVLEWEHIIPKSRGGSDSVKNATLSCSRCNREKGDHTAKEWLEEISAKPEKSELDQARIEGIRHVIDREPQVSNRYCAWVSMTRRYTERNLFSIFGDVECSSGGRTKYNREKVLHLDKDHHLDALCVGSVPESGYSDMTNGYVLMVKAMGHGNRLRGNINACGVIITKYRNRSKSYKGFVSGDIVKADIPRGKYAGRYTGRITIRHTGTFSLKTTDGAKIDVNCKHLAVIQKADGYNYKYERRTA